MKLTKFAILVSLFCAFQVSGQERTHDFRMTNWYDTVEDVKAAETAKFLEHRVQEINIAVSPPKPFLANNLYFIGELLDRDVLIQYEFDIECGQLFKAAYIFENELDDRDIAWLSEAISDKYGVPPKTQYFEHPPRTFVSFKLPTSMVDISSHGDMHIYPGRTSVRYNSPNWGWFGGFAEGKEPQCEALDQRLQKLQKNL